MKILVVIVRTLLGLIFIVFGLNGFFQFLPMGSPPPSGSAASHFFTAVSTTNYMNVVFACEILGGLLVLFNFLPVLGLTILCPVIFNILLFHATMMPTAFGFGLGSTVAVFALILIGYYWDHYRHLIRQPAK